VGKDHIEEQDQRKGQDVEAAEAEPRTGQQVPSFSGSNTEVANEIDHVQPAPNNGKLVSVKLTISTCVMGFLTMNPLY
jgi:hypothetical protein